MKSKSHQRGSMTLGYMFLILILGVGGIYFYTLAREHNAAEDHTIRAQQQCDIAQQQLRTDIISDNPKSLLVADGQQIKAACAVASQAGKAEQAQDEKQYDGPKRALQAMASFRAQPGK